MKNHQDETYLKEQIALGKTSKDIATENNVSYKLVEIYLSKFNIPFTPKHKQKERDIMSGFQKSDNNVTITINNKKKSVYTYEVNMIVSVFAESELDAATMLDSNGGYVSHRKVDLRDVSDIYVPED